MVQAERSVSTPQALFLYHFWSYRVLMGELTLVEMTIARSPVIYTKVYKSRLREGF